PRSAAPPPPGPRTSPAGSSARTSSRRTRAGSSLRRTAAPARAARAAAPPPARAETCAPTPAAARRAWVTRPSRRRRSQRDAVLPNRDLAEAVALVLGLCAAAGDVEHQRIQLGPQLLERAGAERDRARVEVDPARLHRRQVGI